MIVYEAALMVALISAVALSATGRRGLTHRWAALGARLTVTALLIPVAGVGVVSRLGAAGLALAVVVLVVAVVVFIRDVVHLLRQRP